MKRDIRLHALSDDHHAALVLARRAVRAGEGEGDIAPDEVWAEVVRSFEQELAPHFAIEERFLVPALEHEGETALAERTLADHARLRAIVYDDASSLAQRLSEFGAVLREHVRFEERVLFPAMEAGAGAGALDAVAAACRERDAVS